VTITAAAENNFPVANFGTAAAGFAWIGASDAAVEGEWRWVTGPEAGSQFWQGGSAGSTTAPFNFARWASAQPDDFGNQDFAEFALSGQFAPAGQWIDVGSGTSVVGYLIEFDAVPEPSLGALLGLSSFLLAARVRRGARRT
jgi:hypothetical protein